MALSMSNPVLSGANAGKPFLQRTQTQQPIRDFAAPTAQPTTTPVRQGATDSLSTEGVASRRANQPIKVPFSAPSEPSAGDIKRRAEIEQPISLPPLQEAQAKAAGAGSFVNLSA